MIVSISPDLVKWGSTPFRAVRGPLCGIVKSSLYNGGGHVLSSAHLLDFLSQIVRPSSHWCWGFAMNSQIFQASGTRLH